MCVSTCVWLCMYIRCVHTYICACKPRYTGALVCVWRSEDSLGVGSILRQGLLFEGACARQTFHQAPGNFSGSDSSFPLWVMRLQTHCHHTRLHVAPGNLNSGLHLGLISASPYWVIIPAQHLSFGWCDLENISIHPIPGLLFPLGVPPTPPLMLHDSLKNKHKLQLNTYHCYCL